MVGPPDTAAPSEQVSCHSVGMAMQFVSEKSSYVALNLSDHRSRVSFRRFKLTRRSKNFIVLSRFVSIVGSVQKKSV